MQLTVNGRLGTSHIGQGQTNHKLVTSEEIFQATGGKL